MNGNNYHMRISKYISIILGLVFSLSLVSCVDMDDFFSWGDGEKQVVQIKLNILEENSIGENNLKLRTKAPNNITEDKVSDIWVLQFGGALTSSSRVGTPQYINVTTEFLGLSLNASTDTNRIVIIANTHNSSFDWTSIATYQDLLDKMQTVATEDNLYGGVSNQGILMSGYTDVIVNNIVSSSPLLIDLTRSVAKVEFNLALNSSCGVTIDSIMLCDIPSEFHIADKLKSTHNTLPTLYPSHTTTSFTSFKIITDLPTAGGATKTFQWYLPRNQKGITTSTSEKDKNDYVPYSSSYIKVCGTRTSDSKKVYFNIYPGNNMTNDFNIFPNSKYNIRIRLNSVAQFNVDTRVEDSVITDYTKLSYSNCYIINPPPTGMTRYYRIPVGRVDEYWGSQQTGYGNNSENLLSTSNSWTVSLLWQDFKYIVRSSGTSDITITKSTGFGKNDYFELAVPSTANDGNFVIKIVKGSSILWSWHFWVTDYNPYYTGTVTSGSTNQKYTVSGGSVHRYADNGVTMWSSGGELANSYALDRNIGQLEEIYTPATNKRGTLYYQYGRKDPFPANITLYNISGGTVTYSTSANAENSQSTMANSVQNPLVFYRRPTGNWWCSDINLSSNIWNGYNITSSNNLKSIFDPSPWGFRLPENDTWSNFSTSSMTWSTNRRRYQTTSVNASFYADGYRTSLDGTLSDVKTYGLFWTSSPYYYWMMTSSSVSATSSQGAYGFCCRSVRE